MPNSFLTTKLIARQTLPRLIENLVMPNLCYRDFSEDFAKQGDTIRVRKPVVLTAQTFTVGTPVNAQDVVEDSVDVKLDTIATVDVNIEAIEMATNVDDLNRLVIEPAAAALAQKINEDGLKMYKYFPAIGAAGTTPDGLDDFAAIRKALNVANVPLDNRVAIWDPNADAEFTQIGNLVKVSESGSPRALREGEIGRVFGLDNYMSQTVQAHTASTLTAGGTAASGVKIKSAVTADDEVILVSNGTASATLTGSVVVGDVLDITHGGAHIIATVVEAATAESNELTVKLDKKVTVSANDAAELKSFTANLAFHRNAIAFVTRPLIAPSGADSYTTSYNGLSLRVVRDYDISLKQEKIAVDVLYGSRSADDLVQLKEIQEKWMKAEGVNVYLTIDREQEGWDGHGAAAISSMSDTSTALSP